MIKPNFNMEAIRDQMAKATQNVGNAIISRLSMLGEECVNNARTSGDYTDRTGNLRSSIGYIVLAEGKQVKANFTIVQNGAEGEQNAKDLAQSLSYQFPTGYTLIVVAGMKYAYYVETQGRNVLSSAEHYAIKRLPEMMNQLSKNINKFKK